MGWLFLLLLVVVTVGLLWRWGHLPRGAAQLVGMALCLAIAGYAWQGNPGYAGQPAAQPVRAAAIDPEEQRGGTTRGFDTAARWLITADAYLRQGDARGAADILGNAIQREKPSADLWVGLGNALLQQSGGMMTPAAQLAFERAAAIDPMHPGPPFFTGLGLAQTGRLDEAEAAWRGLLARSPEGAPWVVDLRARLIAIDQVRRQMGMPEAPAAPAVPQAAPDQRP